MDGSRRQDAAMNAVLGAGVAWQGMTGEEEMKEGEVRYKSTTYPLGMETGGSEDAELFAIAAALRLAVERAERS